MKRVLSLFLFSVSLLYSATMKSQEGGVVRAHGAVAKTTDDKGSSLHGESGSKTKFNTELDAQFKDPNPYIDVTNYHVRAVSSAPSATGTISAGSTHLILNVPSTFVNRDGITCRGCGPKLAIATPAAPTVSPANASNLLGTGGVVRNVSGGATYGYCIAARTFAGGLTPCSPIGSTVAGPAALGLQTVSIASWKRVNNVVTVNTSTPHNLVPFTMIETGGNGQTLQSVGWYRVDTVPSKTSFTFRDGKDSRNGAPTSGSGGTIMWFQGNHLNWTQVPGAWQYVIYGLRAGVMTRLGVSTVSDTVFTSDPTYNNFDDWGSPITSSPGLPSWIPTTPPVVGKDEDLTTTIVSGAGTVNLVLAAPAKNTVAGAPVIFDNAPTLKAAARAASGAGGQTGVLFFPAASGKSYPTASAVNLDNFPGSLSVMQAGSVALGDTLLLGNTTWTGWPVNALSYPSFSWQPYPSISSGTASPMIYTRRPTWFSYLCIAGNSANGQLLWLHDGNARIPSSTWDHVTFSTSGTADYSSRHLLIRNNVNSDSVFNFNFMTFVAGPNQSEQAPVPLFQVTQGSGPFVMNHVFLNRRGMYMGTATTGLQGTINQLYIQGSIMPTLTVFNNVGGNTSIGLDIKDSIQDTTFNPVVAYFGGGITGTISLFGSNAFTAFSGDGTIAVTSEQAGSPGQNVQYDLPMLSGRVLDGIQSTASFLGYSEKILGGALSIDSSYLAFVNGPGMDAPTCAVSAGGTVAVAHYAFKVVPVYATGGEGRPSPVSDTCTTTAGKQTITIAWTSVPHAIGYDLYKLGGNSYFSFQCAAPLVNGLATQYVWTGAATCGQALPSMSAAGPTAMAQSGLFAPSLKLSTSTGAGLTTLTAPSDTANRAVTFPDAGGVVGIKPTTVTAVNDHCVKWSVASNVPTLNDSGVPCTVAALGDPGGNGIVVRTALDATANRTMQSTSGNALTWTNADGVSGNPTPALVFPSKIFIPGALCNNATAVPAWSLPTSNAAAASCNSGSNVQEGTLDFADGQSAQYALLLPNDWTGAIDARAIFFDSSTSGTVIFQIATACAAVNGTVTDNTAFNAADSFATITLNSAANAQWETTKTGVNTTGCSTGDTLQVKISRTADTAANLARLKGVELTVRRSL
jgi:hypothetical protein